MCYLFGFLHAIFSISMCVLVTVCFLSVLPAHSLLLPSVRYDLDLPNQRFLHLSLVVYSYLRGRGLKELGSSGP